MIKRKISFVGRLVFAIPALLVYFLSTAPQYTFHKETESGLVIAMKHVTHKVHECTEEEVKQFLEEESKKGRKHLRKRASACGSRERVPMKLVVWLDGKEILNRTYSPSGFHNDGNTFIFKKFIIPTGEHHVKIGMVDSNRVEGFDFVEEKTLDFPGLTSITIDFDSIEKVFLFT